MFVIWGHYQGTFVAKSEGKKISREKSKWKVEENLPSSLSWRMIVFVKMRSSLSLSWRTRTVKGSVGAGCSPRLSEPLADSGASLPTLDPKMTMTQCNSVVSQLQILHIWKLMKCRSLGKMVETLLEIPLSFTREDFVWGTEL